jgi:hypothetical protein
MQANRAELLGSISRNPHHGGLEDGEVRCSNMRRKGKKVKSLKSFESTGRTGGRLILCKPSVK